MSERSERMKVASDALLDVWDKRIDSLRDEAHRCRANGNDLRASHLEGKANAYAKAHKELSASNSEDHARVLPSHGASGSATQGGGHATR